MIKWLIIIFLLCNHTSFAGVSVVGTRFIFNDNSKKINIKLINDNESDYLIKTDIKGADTNNFVVTPPLFIIKKNQKNIVSIIPFKINFNQDQVFDLVFTAIPKSDIGSGNNINISVRSHFNLIYRHKEMSDNIFDQIFLINNKDSGSLIFNSSDYFVSMYISCNSNKVNKMNQKINIFPGDKVYIQHCNEIWGALLNDDESLGLVNKLKINKQDLI
jgi:P pilus assembly chaperone PapD